MTSMALTDAEKSACTTLSHLFLDTEITTEELNSITTSLRALNLPSPTLDRILRYDLFPILYPNIISVAGVWSGFDDYWLLSQVESRRMTEPSRIRTVQDSAMWFLLSGAVKPLWSEIRVKL
ncbi:hypothetical protein TWF718_005306 [Orbilia javanica]|uniref:DUF7079 domain-containing protein n=1 Tax=Orbilia javanica TaxID=47235 RepID=A0AAN8MRU0_9PEZI